VIIIAKRTTLKELDGIIKNINSSLKRRKINKQVKLGRRYGYKAIDLYDTKGSMVKTLRAGMSSGEVKEYLYAMQEGYDLFYKRKNK